MKPIQLTIASLVILICSCSKQPVTSNIDPVNDKLMSASINNTFFRGDKSTIKTSWGDDGRGDTVHEFNASQGDTTLSIYTGMLSKNITGNYSFSTNTLHATMVYNDGNKTYLGNKAGMPTIGTIVITSFTSTTINGTFAGVLYAAGSTTDSIVITNGVFNNISY